MTVDNAGPVSMGEVQEVVTHLNALLSRAMDNNQHSYGMVLHIAAESLHDNLEQVEEWGTDAE